MRWVTEPLPPRVRPRWLLRMRRLTSSSLAGTTRALVAVGTARLAAMLVAIRACAPLRTAPAAPPASGAASGPASPAPSAGRREAPKKPRQPPHTDETSARDRTHTTL